MALIAIGASHRTAPVEVREKFAYAASEVDGLLARIRAAGAREVALLSTCNRTELYLIASEVDPVPAVLIRPDCHVAWTGDPSDPDLLVALTTWFGPPDA